MAPLTLLLAGILALTTQVTAIIRRPIPIAPPDEFPLAFPFHSSTTSPATSNTTTNTTVPVSGNATFTQLIDHTNPALGTFTQHYLYSSEYYAGPGSPIILFTPGEANVSSYTSYLTTKRLTGVFAQALGAGIIALEHRYWGLSSPFAELTTENMQYLTLDNAIADLTHFARNTRLPFDPEGTSRAPIAPWLLTGGSYSGALTAWTAALAPGTFWAYTASSAVVETVYDFWQYFEPVKAGLPVNCTRDLEAVVEYVDDVLLGGTLEEQAALKRMFGLEGLEHNDDFGAAIEAGPWLWQSLQFYTGDYVFDFCDAVEGVTRNSTVLPGPQGVGVQKALAGYANWFKTVELPGTCASYGYSEWTAEDEIRCYDTYNASSPIFTDTSLADKTGRSWEWFLCNEPFGWWQTGAPRTVPSIVSRLVTASYWQRQCSLYFPPSASGFTFNADHSTEAAVNLKTGGWDLTVLPPSTPPSFPPPSSPHFPPAFKGQDNEDNDEEGIPRLLFINGQHDPWRDATVSSDSRPDGPLNSTAENPVWVIPDGIHCSDLVSMNGLVDEGVQAVIDAEVAQVKAWFGEWPGNGKWEGQGQGLGLGLGQDGKGWGGEGGQAGQGWDKGKGQGKAGAKGNGGGWAPWRS